MKPAITIALLLILTSACSRSHTRIIVGPDTPSPITFDGSSQLLKATEIVPTLDAPMPANKNVIWCASFQSAWKSLEDLAGEPIALAPSNSVSSLRVHGTFLSRVRPIIIKFPFFHASSMLDNPSDE